MGPTDSPPGRSNRASRCHGHAAERQALLWGDQSSTGSSRLHSTNVASTPLAVRKAAPGCTQAGLCRTRSPASPRARHTPRGRKGLRGALTVLSNRSCAPGSQESAGLPFPLLMRKISHTLVGRREGVVSPTCPPHSYDHHLMVPVLVHLCPLLIPNPGWTTGNIHPIVFFFYPRRGFFFLSFAI